MDDLLARQLSRQLKILNIWVTIFGSLFLISLIVIGVLLWKVVSFTQNTADKVDNLQDKAIPNLNIKEKACSSDSFGSLLEKQTEACN